MAARSDRKVSLLRLRHPANTAYDQSVHQSAYHMSRAENPATCAGFLLRGATHSIGFRPVVITGKIEK